MGIIKRFIHKDHPDTTASKPEATDPGPANAQETGARFRILTQRHIDALQSEQAENREAVIQELAAMGAPVVDELVPALEEWYQYSKSDACSLVFRISVARTLGLLGDARAINPLIKMADKVEKTLEHRKIAAESLARIGQPAFQPMLDLLQNGHPNDQQLSAWALGKMGNPKAVPYLIPLLSKQPFHYPHVRSAANKALIELTGQNFGENIELWEKWVNNNRGNKKSNIT